jgi:hypothetical protein
MEDSIDPLSRQQQIFLQRFLASHVLTDQEAQTLFNNILQEGEQQQQQQQVQHRNCLGRDVKDTFKRINRSLTPAFRLEIRSVALSLFTKEQTQRGDGDIDIDIDEDSSRTTNNKPKSVVYHTIVNCDADEVAKTAANPTFTKSPHELAFFRLILEKLVEKDADADNDGNSNGNSSRGKGCTSYMSRMDMINSRLSLSGVHEGKLSITQTENALDLLEVQGWLVGAFPPNDGAGDENVNIMSPENTRRSSRRRTGGSASGSSSGRSKYLQIGPRSYLEFPDFLIKVGLDKDKLPQFLLNV